MERLLSGSELVEPPRLWCRTEVLVRPSPVPSVPGVYAWYFREVPPRVPVAGCITRGDLTLLYVGISPKRPPANGRPSSRQHLRKRVCYHLRGNAAGSTLRLTLGCLLSERLSIEPRRVGSGDRRTFADGEARLSRWMEENALVCWLPAAEPWILEDELIASLSLPLNLEGNDRHPFHSVLSALRREARARADRLPVWRGA